MGWKDYFYFSKTERSGITVLILLIVAVILFPFVYHKLVPEKTYDYSEFDTKVRQYEEMLADYHMAQEQMEAARALEKLSASHTRAQLTPFPFDPNTLNQEEFLEMGLSERVASNIINYRNAGGQFRFKEDVKRIYSINESLYAQLEGFIELPSRTEYFERKTLEESRTKEELAEKKTDASSPASILIEINKADTTQWQKIRGIGPVFSRRITSYRDLLGGYYSLNQLLEVYGMDTVRYEQIAPHIKLDSIQLKTININTADFVTLVRHPYLDRNQVNSILKMRERHGLYSSVEEIKKSQLIDDSLFDKIAPYLSVTDPPSETVNEE